MSGVEIVRVAGNLLDVTYRIDDRIAAAELATRRTADAVARKVFAAS